MKNNSVVKIISIVCLFSTLFMVKIARTQASKGKRYLVVVSPELKWAQESINENVLRCGSISLTGLQSPAEFIAQLRKKTECAHVVSAAIRTAICLTDSSLAGLEHLPASIKRRDSIRYTIRFHESNLKVYYQTLRTLLTQDSVLWLMEQDHRFEDQSDSSIYYSSRIAEVSDRLDNQVRELKRLEAALQEFMWLQDWKTGRR